MKVFASVLISALFALIDIIAAAPPPLTYCDIDGSYVFTNAAAPYSNSTQACIDIGVPSTVPSVLKHTHDIYALRFWLKLRRALKGCGLKEAYVTLSEDGPCGVLTSKGIETGVDCDASDKPVLCFLI